MKQSSKKGLPDNWTRGTFIFRQDLLLKMKDLAYTNRTTYKEEFEKAMEEYLKDKEVIEDPNLER